MRISLEPQFHSSLVNLLAHLLAIGTADWFQPLKAFPIGCEVAVRNSASQAPQAAAKAMKNLSAMLLATLSIRRDPICAILPPTLASTS